MVSCALPSERFAPVRAALAFSVAVGGVACSPDAPSQRDQIPEEGPWTYGVELAAEPQSDGDPDMGRDLLLGGDFMTCGIPQSLWDNPLTRPIITSAFGGADETIPDRTGPSADLPYQLNAFRTPDTDVEVVNANCLMCHGATFNGEFVLGMGNTAADFTVPGGGATSIDPSLIDALGLPPLEREQFDRMIQRAKALEPYSDMRTVGHNPAEMYAVVLMAHHDRDTLAWSDDPLTPLTIEDESGNPIPDAILTSKPPPWWRAHKKNALFWNGMARGDHRGTMALATSVCVDSIDRAEEVDEQFRHIQRFVESIRAPAYPLPIDEGLAEEGHAVFLAECAGCHGTYGDGDEWYPNLIFPLSVINTDPAVALAGVVHAPELVDWYNDSFYGQVTRMDPDDPFPGYMAPPLDGIWAAAPYLHNGSVPTVAALLDSSLRPTYWKRVDYNSKHFDEEALGWPYEAVPYAQADAPADEQKDIYDTTYWSQSNGGHLYGDHLSPAERRALIEYMKTL